MSTVAKRTTGFARQGMYKSKTAHAFEYLSERTTFWVAVMSLFAFVSGNMLGQHGWTVFWASVLGNEPVIVFDGAVPPLPSVPDYEKWARLGGNVHEHTYRQIPRDYLLPFPKYDASHLDERYFMVDYMGTYETGTGEGSHPGTDIAAPVGTPVLSIANGIVFKVGNDAGGYGNYVVIKHPNVPDPSRPSTTTTLYSVYAHLDSTMVLDPDTVKKGQQIGTVGMTGFTTGPHLHFQIDREEAPWHPYWPFSGSEARAAGLTMMQAVNTGFRREQGLRFTVNGMLFIQRFPDGSAVVKKPASTVTQAARSSVSAQQARADRVAQRKARIATETMALVSTTAPVQRPSLVVGAAASSSSSSQAAAVTQVVALATAPTAVPVATILIRHDGGFTGREREKVSITLLDDAGREIAEPIFPRTLELRTAFGQAEFFPSSLTAKDFVSGKAQVEMLPRGQQTVVIQLQPTGTMSKPMTYEK